MALTDAERTRIRQLMGWSERFHQVDTALEQAMNAIDHLSSVGNVAPYDAIAASVAECTRVDSILRGSAAQASATGGPSDRLMATKVGSLEIDAITEIAGLRSLARAEVSKIAVLLGVEVRHDVYSGAAPRFRSGWHGPARGGGNLVPRG